MITTYEHIRISPYKIERLEKLTILQKINSHAKLHLTALIPEEEKDNPIYDTTASTSIEVKSLEEEGVIFKGLVEKIKIKQVQGLYYLEIEGTSFSKQLDIKIKSRSFQDKGMTYEKLIKEVTQPYKGGDVIDTASKGAPIKKLVMQYEETDWVFVKRLASHFNAGLVPYVKQEGVKYFFGIPEGKERGELKEYNYTVTKNITQYLQSKENTNPSLMDLDKLYYQVETEKFFEIGDTVKYEDKTLYVKEVHLQIEQAILKNTYKLTTKKGCSQDKCYNEKIIGLSLQGSVLETSKDQLKLHLAIDKSQDVGKAWFFKYATPYTASGHSGWYCMPELDDTVYAYFPTKDEGEGIAFSSIRTKDLGSDKLSDTAIKYLRTKYGKELKFAPGELLITCIDEGIFIKLNDKTGIEIFSTKPIKIHTPQDLTVDSGKKIYMTAQEEINLTCKASNIKMDGDIVVQGKEVKSN